MPSVTEPNYRIRKWTTASGEAKERWEVSFFIIDGQQRQRVLRSRSPSLKAAKALYQDLVKEILGGKFGEQKPQVPTLGEFVETFHGEGSASKRPITIATERFATEWLLKVVPADTPLDQVTTKHIDQFVARQIAAGYAEATVIRRYSTISRLFNVAVRWEHLERNPASGAARVKLPEGDVVFLELHEQKALLAACSVDSEDEKHNVLLDTPYLRPMVALALYTGLRRGELFHLRWCDIDFDHRRLTVRNSEHFTTKTKKNRTIELTEGALVELKAWQAWFRREIARSMERAADSSLPCQLRQKAEGRLEMLRRCEPRDHRLVFPSFKSAGTDGEAVPMDNVRKALANAVKEAGIKRTVGLHTLRHTFAVTLARHGVPLTKISKALGHTTLRTTQIYLRFTPDEGADVTKYLPDLSGAGSAAQVQHGPEAMTGA